jgi:HTH-type transcriptional regulator/antitoxin HigA
VEWTFSNEQEKEVVEATTLSMDSIQKFASKFNTHPALIIGRFHKKGFLPYSRGIDFFVKLEFSQN